MRATRIALTVAAVMVSLHGHAFCFETFVVNGEAPFSWPATSSDTPLANRISREQVQKFLNQFDPRHDDVHFNVDEFRFATLRRNSVALVASVDASGRGLFFSLVGVQPRSEGTWDYFIVDSSPPHMLGGEIVDLDGDGISEIISRTVVGGYQGAATFPVYWYSILRLGANGSVEDVSAGFARFYQARVMPEIALVTNLIDNVALANRTVEMRWMRAQARFVRDKFDRVVNGTSDAGLDTAISWINEADPRFVLLGVQALGEVRTPRAISFLRTLANSTNEGVATAARATLQE